jgi:transcriptional antiterminator RfaH
MKTKVMSRYELVRMLLSEGCARRTRAGAEGEDAEATIGRSVADACLTEDPKKMSSEWYVLQTKPRKEEFVASQLGARNAEVYLPKLVESIHVAGARVQRVVPMFPTYLFVKLDLEGRSIGLRYTPGVKDFLRCDGAPAQVSPTIVAGLQDRTGPSEIYCPPPPYLKPGARLRIDEGPLRGMDVIFEQELSGPERVAVLLAEVNFHARVVLSRHALATS